MGAIADILNSAGPFAGWVVSGLLGTALLWWYATDRLVSAGRHQEQAVHFQQKLELQQAHFEREMEQQKRHYEEVIADLQQRHDAQTGDKAYWRDHAVDLMGAVAAQVGRT